MKGIRHIVFFSLYFLVLYGENFSVFTIPFTLLWKVPLIGFIVVYVVNLKRKTISVNFSKKSVYLSIQKNFNTSLNFGFENLIEVLKTINLSLFTYFLINYYQFSVSLKKILKSLAIYTIISFLPFSLNLVNSVNSGVNVEVFGGDSGITGVFSSPHTAAITVAVSVLILIFFFSEWSSRMKIIIGILIIYGLYIILFTYTRTGLVSLVLSLIYYFVKKSGRQNILKALIILILVSFPIYYIVSNNESLQNKILDKRQDDQVLNSNNAGSGRLLMWQNSLNIWLESDLIGKALGIGEKASLEQMRRKMGKPFFSHNEFFDILIRYGLFGLILYLIYLRSIYLFIVRKTLEGSGSIAIYISYIINLFFQGGHFFVFELFLALFIVYDYKRKMEFEQNRQ